MRGWTWVVVAATTVCGVVASSEPAAARTPQCAGALHTVVAGDTWFEISRAVGVSLRGLLEANDLEDVAVIKPGDTVCLPPFAVVPVPTTAAPPTTVPAACATTYTVVLDDSWFSIARKSGTTMTALLAANGADASAVLQPGEALCLPPSATPATTTTTTTVAPTPSAPTCATSTYTVVLDDNWSLIARKSKVAMPTLLETNGATDRTVLQPGDVLCLPKQAAVPPAAVATGALAVLPVQGPCWYGDTWMDPRGGERRHEGVDLITARGQNVYAVADGKLTARAWDQPGLRAGNAWWLRANDGTSYFYAHMSGFAPGLGVGSVVEAGQIIGFVGSTGNAAGPHLHFEIHPRGGAAINPSPVVKAIGGCNKVTAYVQP